MRFSKLLAAVFAVSLMFGSPAHAQVLSETAKEELKTTAQALLDEISAVVTKGESARGPAGPLAELVKNSGDLVCQSWIIAFSVSMRNAAINNWPVTLQEKLNELRWKIEKLCADPPPRVGKTGPIAPLPPPTTPTPPRHPDDVDADACRAKCSAEWQAYTQAIMDATPAENAARTANDEARRARQDLEGLLSAESNLRPDQQQARARLNIPAARQNAEAKEAARARADAALKAARAKIDAAQAAYIACLERCKKYGKRVRTATYSAIGAGGTALAFGLSSGGSATPVATIQQPTVAPPVAAAPASPPAQTPAAPTPPTTTTPATPPNPAGTYASRTTVTFDPAQHGPVIALDGQLSLAVTINGQSITINALSNGKWIATSGTIASDGTFLTSGTGTVVGIPGVAVTFNGRIDPSASPMRITGEYAVGTNGALPQGQPIRYAIDGQKQ